MIISLIVAVAENGVIGRKGKLPWHFSEDLKRFKELTTGKVIIMGRKTYESIVRKVGGPLKDRTHIIVTRQFGYESKAKGCAVSDSLEKALKVAQRVAGAKVNPDEEIFVIGGEQIYRQAMQYANRLYITRIPKRFKGDTYFPKIDETIWEVVQAKGVLFKKHKMWGQFIVLEKRRKKALDN